MTGPSTFVMETTLLGKLASISNSSMRIEIALLGEVSHRQRIICIEDTAELRPNHPHILGLVSRGTNTEGKGAITMADLLKQSLRMRPDRIVVGEIRGAEVIDLLAALNTGHDGCADTMHANWWPAAVTFGWSKMDTLGKIIS